MNLGIFMVIASGVAIALITVFWIILTAPKSVRAPRPLSELMRPFSGTPIGQALNLGLNDVVCRPLLRLILVRGHRRSFAEQVRARRAVLAVVHPDNQVHYLARALRADDCREAALALEIAYPGITRREAGFDP